MIKQRDFMSALKFVAGAMAKRDIRYYLNGLLFSFLPDNKLVLVGTDGHRLHKIVLTVEHQIEGDFIVDGVGIKSLISVFKVKGDCEQVMEIDFTADGRTVMFNNRMQSITATIIDGTYPNWERVIPSEVDRYDKPGDNLNRRSDGYCGINADYVMESMKAAKFIANSKYKGVKLMLGESANDSVVININTAHDEYPAIASDGLAIVMPMRL